ncbi:ABC transporter substrate-binding protein [Aneurinibacillus tyrosinisolvens]|uniref:ABC transporter substrate-binding protein n=1 Tax=Aneurinibacillus tyrosinisolvens TaxID=1443435 RepID=UPI00063F798B|nr:ABC transporter substrate-binding protein [Aneurinibacillus tyrosinisolvens]
MRLANDYLQLRKSFPQSKEGETFQVAMAELAGALFCSPRNAKLILTKMIDVKWLSFVPGRGRGNTSELTFLIHTEELVVQKAKELVRNGEVEAAFQLLLEFSENPATKERFVDWLSGYFGYQVEEEENRSIEALKLPIYRTINTLDPAQSYYAFDSHMIKQVFATLVEYDYEAHKIAGGIAHHWVANGQGTEWTFYLRKRIHFHHGRELTADDVVYSLTRLRSDACPQNWLVKGISEIKALSRYTVHITLKEPNYLFLLFLSFAPASIVPSDVYKEGKRAAGALPIGSGPYQVTKWTPGICVLEAFDSYFQGRAPMDRIEIIIVPESHGSLTFEFENDLLMVHTGEAAMPPVRNWTEAKSLCGSNIMTMNTKKEGILQNLYFRKALHHLVNRQRMVAGLGEPRLYPASSFELGEHVQAFDKDWNPEEGLRMLRQSGYSGEILHLFAYRRHAPDAYWLKEEYKKYGIHIDVTIVSWADMLVRENMEKADFTLFEPVLSEGVIRLIECYYSVNSFLRAHVDEGLASFIDESIRQVLAEQNEEARTQKLQAIEERLKQEYAMVFLVYKSVSTTFHPSLQGVKVGPGGWVDFKDVWFQIEQAHV